MLNVGYMGACPPSYLEIFSKYILFSLCWIFMYFVQSNIQHVSGHRGSAPGPRWGTSVPDRPPLLSPTRSIFLATPQWDVNVKRLGLTMTDGTPGTGK